jgi:hypothetical protein
MRLLAGMMVFAGIGKKPQFGTSNLKTFKSFVLRAFQNVSRFTLYEP